MGIMKASLSTIHHSKPSRVTHQSSDRRAGQVAGLQMKWFSAVWRSQPRPRTGMSVSSLCRCQGSDTNTGRCLRLRSWLWWNWPIYNAVRIHYPACSLPPSTALARCTGRDMLVTCQPGCRRREAWAHRSCSDVRVAGESLQQPQPQILNCIDRGLHGHVDIVGTFGH